MRWESRLGALSERNFRLLWLGQTTSVLGDALVPVALAFAVLELTGSASDVGYVLAAHITPFVVLVLAGGVWADRLPRQFVMLASDVVRCAVQTTSAVLLLSHTAELWNLIVLAAVYGAAEAFFQPASTGLLPSTVGPPRLQEANALLGLSRSAAFIVGPALAGVIVAAWNPGGAFAVDACTFVVSVLSLAMLRIRWVQPVERKSFLEDLAGGWRELRSRTWLWVIIVWATTYLCLVVAPVMVLGPVIAKDSLGGARAWGAILAFSAVGSLCGAGLALRWRPLRPMLACCLLVLLGAPTPLLLALEQPAAAIAAAQFAGGLAMGFFMAVWQTTLQQHIPPDKLSRVSAYDWMGSLAFFPIGLALTGPVASVIGIRATLLVSAGWVVASTIIVLLVPGVRALRRTDVGARADVVLDAPGPAGAAGGG
jgi:MFS family permease